MTMIRSSAPTRVDLGGAHTDVEPFKSEEGGFVVNAALDVRVDVTIAVTDDSPHIVITSRDLGTEERFSSIETMDHSGELRLIKAAITHIRPPGAIHVTTSTEAPPGSGLGASAALAVALLGALHRCRGETPAPEELVHDAMYVENVLLGNINGGQDQYASVLGGFHALAFGPEQKVDVTALPLRPSAIDDLEERSLLVYSGESHLSGHVLDQIMANYRRGDRHTVGALRDLKRIAYETERALVEAAFDDLAALIAATGEAQHLLHPVMTPPTVRRLAQIGTSHGALASKMVGAGGGGCMFFLCVPERKQELARALDAEGAQVLPTRFSARGVQCAPAAS
jgi:D-glycero-alpha-D-manno-heptose-7-phosphate kinase